MSTILCRLARRSPALRSTPLVRCYSAADAQNQVKPQQTSDDPSSATSTSAAQPFSVTLTPGPVPLPTETTVISQVLAGTKLDGINYFKNRQDPIAMADHEYPAWLWKVLDADKEPGAAADGEDVGDEFSKSKKARRVAAKRTAKLAALEALNPEVKVPIEEQTLDLPFATVSNEKYEPRGKTTMTKLVSAVGGVGHGLPREGHAGAKKGLMGWNRPTTVKIGAEGEVRVTAADAAAARLEVKKAMRKKNRAKIKEANFLSQM